MTETFFPELDSVGGHGPLGRSITLGREGDSWVWRSDDFDIVLEGAYGSQLV